MSDGDEQKCVYCNDRIANSRDHVPPRNLFPKPKPSDLVTVPSCTQCNQGFKIDEDYFVGIFTFGEGGISKSGKKLWNQRLHRTYKKDKGLANAIARSFVRTRLRTISGIDLGGRLAVKLNPERLNNYFLKIVKGLYYFEFEEILPPSISVNADLITYGLIVNQFNRYVQFGSRRWKGIFEYKLHRSKENKEKTTWLFFIFNSYIFGAITPSKP